MSIKVTLKNYRCFPDNDAAVIELRDGFTAIIGPNNAGKSSLLKFFFEFRKLFELLSSSTLEFDRGFRSGTAFQQIAGTFEPDEVFCNSNNRNLNIVIEFEPEPGSPDWKIRSSSERSKSLLPEEQLCGADDYLHRADRSTWAQQHLPAAPIGNQMVLHSLMLTCLQRVSHALFQKP